MDTASPAMDYWLKVTDNLQTHELKMFAIKLLEIFAHAAGVESRFSGMSSQKTKSRPRMKVDTLKMISQIKMDLQAKNPSGTSTVKSTKDNEDEIKRDVQFEDLDQLQEFEDGVVFDDPEELDDIPIEEQSYIESLFDLTLFNNSHQVSTDVMVVDDSDNESWDKDDLFI